MANLLHNPEPPSDELPPWMWLLIVCVGLAATLGALWLVDWMFK